MQGRHPELDIILDNKERKVLEKISRSRTAESRLVQRAKVILLASEKKYRNTEIGLKVVHFLPTHASWLNQIEVWFSILCEKIIKRGNFSSVKDLEKKIKNYIEKDWNLTAHPFQWTYKGKVCCA